MVKRLVKVGEGFLEREVRQDLIAKTAIYCNLGVYAFVLVLFANGIKASLVDPIMSATIQGAILIVILTISILLTIVLSIALIRRKPWARKFAVPWNLGMAFILVGVKAIGLFVSINSALNKEIILNYFDINTIINILLGMILVVISIVYNGTSLISYFNPILSSRLK